MTPAPSSAAVEGAVGGIRLAAPPAAEPVLLAGDVGGTKTVLALVTAAGEVVAEAAYPSREHAGPHEVVRRFLARFPAPVRRVSLSVAGPVVAGRARITNLPWELDAAALRHELGVDAVHLVNDVQATAHALPHLRPDQLRTILPREGDAAAPRAVVAVGTGLGEAVLLPRDGCYEALASEGGHTDFGPRGRVQRGLLAWLAREYGHVSYERVCSGPGIAHLYRFIRARSGVAEPEWLGRALAGAEDPTPVIVAAGLGGERRCGVCRRTLLLFAAILGAEAGNAALRAMATGGVYLGGGIPPRLVPVLRSRAFAAGFVEKGPMSALLARIPVHVILEPRTALLGAARYGMVPAA